MEIFQIQQDSQYLASRSSLEGQKVEEGWQTGYQLLCSKCQDEESKRRERKERKKDAATVSVLGTNGKDAKMDKESSATTIEKNLNDQEKLRQSRGLYTKQGKVRRLGSGRLKAFPDKDDGLAFVDATIP